MRTARALQLCQMLVLPLVLLAHVLAWWLAFPAAQWLGVNSGTDADGLWIAQLALLTGWAVLGPWRWYVRLPAAILAVTALSFAELNPLTRASVSTINMFKTVQAINAINGASGTSLATWLSFSMMATAAIFFVCVRLTGRRVALLQGLEPPTGPFRYSIRTICLITAAAAVLTRGGQMLRATLEGQALVPVWLVVGVGAPAIGVVALGTYWAMLAPGKVWWRLLLVGLAVGICGVAVPLICARQTEVALFTTWLAIAATIIAGTLWVMRLGGYRLMKQQVVVNSEL